MSFQFDFGDVSAGQKPSAALHESKPRNALSAKLLTIQSTAQPEHVFGELVQCSPSTTLFRRSVSDVKFQIASTETLTGEASNELVESIEQQSDLISGVYEGGLKTWECSIDLVAYLELTYGSSSMHGLQVLELGCGSALPGIYCLKLGAHVDFQDYNEPVLRMVTIPNILLNTICQPVQNDISEGSFETEVVCDQYIAQLNFYSGDWKSMLNLLEASPPIRQYDVILTSETIYEAQCQADLFKLIKAVVKPGGIVLVASKSVYFGCSGSLNDFRRLVISDGSCQISTVFINSQTVRREITQLSF
ncbi:hypothetical protein BDV3_004833 [Batrachochytrium dendrobatidis]